MIKPIKAIDGDLKAGRLVLAGVFVLVIAARAATIARAHNVARDGVIHLYMARQLTEAPWRSVVTQYDYHPMYPALCAAVAKATGAGWPDGWVTVAQAVSAGMSVLGLLCLHYIARRVFNRRIALWTVIIAGLSRPLTGLSADALSDWPALTFGLATVAAAIACARRIRANSVMAVPLAAVAAIAAAGGYLTRPEQLLSAMTAAAIMLFHKGPRQSRLGLKTVCLLVLGGLTLLCVSPYAWAIGGLSQKKNLDDFEFAIGMPMAAVNMGEVARISWRILDRGLDAIGIPAAIFVLLAMGLALARRRFPKEWPRLIPSPSREGVLMMAIPAVVMLPILAAMEMGMGRGYLSSRHTLVVLMFMMPLAGAGAEAGLMLLGRVLKHRPGSSFLSLWAAAVVALAMFPAAIPCLHRGRDTYRQAGRSIRGEGAVLCDDARIALFASAPVEQFVRHSPLRWKLEPADLSSPDALLKRLGAGFRCIAITKEMQRHAGEDCLNVPLMAGLTPVDLPNSKAPVFAYVPPRGPRRE